MASADAGRDGFWLIRGIASARHGHLYERSPPGLSVVRVQRLRPKPPGRGERTRSQEDSRVTRSLETQSPAVASRRSAPTGPHGPERSVAISIDLEMRWGMHDRLGLDMNAYRANLEAGRAAVPEILRILGERGLKATWAAVGALACTGWDEYFARAPAPPSYEAGELAIDARYADLDPDGTLHFLPAELGLIANSQGVDLGTHTFSHIFMLEPGITAHDVAGDLEAVRRLWTDRFGRAPVSLVFPRNQPNFLDVVAQAGIRVWRGNPLPWYYNRFASRHQDIVSRGLRFADALIPLAHTASAIDGRDCRASAFVRFDLPHALWGFHLNRLCRALDGMAPGEVFHLWFHEHNLGPALGHGLARLAEVCDLIAGRCAAGRLRSANMASFASDGCGS